MTSKLTRGGWVRAMVGAEFVEGILTGRCHSFLMVLQPTRRTETPFTKLHHAQQVEPLPDAELSPDQALHVELWREGYRAGNFAALVMDEVPGKGPE